MYIDECRATIQGRSIQCSQLRRVLLMLIILTGLYLLRQIYRLPRSVVVC
jgi:hypothetical protein